MKEKVDAQSKPKDFFDEHEKLKAERVAQREKQARAEHQAEERSKSQIPQQVQPGVVVRQPAGQAPSVSVAQQTIAQPVKLQSQHSAPLHQPALSQNSALQPSGSTDTQSFEELVAGLKELGYEVKPLEALREYAAQLEIETSRLEKEIEEKRRRLEVVYRARELLRRFGV